MRTNDVVAGIFVGGRSSRMGRAKPLLPAPEGGTLVERWVALARGVAREVVLVGRHAEVPALAPVVQDAAPGAGPLGGLVALLTHAAPRPVLALACDMPFVDAALLARLIEAPPGRVVAPRRDGRWEPLFARYETSVLDEARARLVAGERSLQALLDAIGAVALPLSPGEASQLDDWDHPDDLTRRRA